MEDSVPVKEEYTYQVGKIQFIVTPVYKDKGESNSIQNQKKILQKAAKDISKKRRIVNKMKAVPGFRFHRRPMAT